MDLLVLKENLKNISPIFIRKIIREILKCYRETKNKVQLKYLGQDLREEDLLIALKQLGVKEGDILFVHSSLSRLGYVRGGANTVLTALLKSVGSNGTLGAPTFWGFTANHLKGKLTFDVRHTPSLMGVISEAIRTHPAAYRSMHPTHTAAFIGPLSEYLTQNHHLDNTPMGPNSPYIKLIECRGKILLLGVTLEYLTNFHTIEDLVPNLPVDVYLKEPLIFTVIDEKGASFKVSTYCHCPEAGKRRQCMKMKPYLLANHVMKEMQVKNATLTLIDAYLLHETLLSLYEKGITMYSPGY